MTIVPPSGVPSWALWLARRTVVTVGIKWERQLPDGPAG